MARCKSKSCRAEIVFVRTIHGELMPLDPEPDPRGNVEIRIKDGLRTAIVHSQPPLDDTELYMPHWRTCPDAKEFKK